MQTGCNVPLKLIKMPNKIHVGGNMFIGSNKFHNEAKTQLYIKHSPFINNTFY